MNYKFPITRSCFRNAMETANEIISQVKEDLYIISNQHGEHHIKRLCDFKMVHETWADKIVYTGKPEIKESKKNLNVMVKNIS